MLFDNLTKNLRNNSYTKLLKLEPFSIIQLQLLFICIKSLIKALHLKNCQNIKYQVKSEHLCGLAIPKKHFLLVVQIYVRPKTLVLSPSADKGREFDTTCFDVL